MFNCKFALIFLIVLVVYLKQSQGHPIVDKKLAKVPPIVAKVGIAKTTADKIKLAAFKKWVATKAIITAPFILGKKAALLKIGAIKSMGALKLGALKSLGAFKIGAVKSLVAAKVGAVNSLGAFKIGAIKSLAELKLAKTKKIFGLKSKKVIPAVAAVAALPAAAVESFNSVSGLPAAALASINSVAGLPAAALAAFSAKPVPAPAPVPVVDIYEVPHYQVTQPNAHFSSSIVSSYKDGLDTPRSYSNGYSVSLLPAGEVSTQYQYYSLPSTPRETYGAADLPEVSESHKNSNEEIETEVVVPHTSYGVPT